MLDYIGMSASLNNKSYPTIHSFKVIIFYVC